MPMLAFLPMSSVNSIIQIESHLWLFSLHSLMPTEIYVSINYQSMEVNFFCFSRQVKSKGIMWGEFFLFPFMRFSIGEYVITLRSNNFTTSTYAMAYLVIVISLSVLWGTMMRFDIFLFNATYYNVCRIDQNCVSHFHIFSSNSIQWNIGYAHTRHNKIYIDTYSNDEKPNTFNMNTLAHIICT